MPHEDRVVEIAHIFSCVPSGSETGRRGLVLVLVLLLRQHVLFSAFFAGISKYTVAVFYFSAAEFA